MKKSLCMLCLAVILSFGLCAPTLAGKYPGRTINIINPFLPGGFMDLTLRPVIEEMSKDLGVSVITTPTPGAGGSIGYTKASRARPDGYTLVLSIHSTLLCNGMLRSVRYSADSFVPVAAFCMNPTALSIRTGDTRFGSLDAFLAYAKAHPGELSVGMAGTKGTGAAATALLEAETGIKLKWVPFDGTIAANAALASGHVDCVVSQTLQSSGITGLMLFGRHMDAFPGIPTSKELGYPFEWPDFLVIFAPKGLPEEKRRVLEKAVLDAAIRPSVLDALRNLGLNSMPLTGAEVQAALDESKTRLVELIEREFIKPEPGKR